MQHILFKLLLIMGLATLSCTPLLASGDHDHGHSHKIISKKEAIAISKDEILAVIVSGKVDQSWANVSVKSVSKHRYNGFLEWVITYNNPKIEDPSKQTLYVFIDLNGHTTGINYTGE